eukprot:TRINITY_DN1694_c0_g1_i5.p1 TRINITY_DN1694_c0_g1~~TRINITY_DN1694_c0_g1_i5.p1  ORF type:complete len:121 (-),score=6.68 TRINITY_DN1694_c0_g1_i5:43-405(-)
MVNKWAYRCRHNRDYSKQCIPLVRRMESSNLRNTTMLLAACNKIQLQYNVTTSDTIWVHLSTQLNQQQDYCYQNLHFFIPMYSALIPVSYTHLTLPTILLVQISVVAVSLKKKNKKHPQT